MGRMPALSLAAVPGRRNATISLATEIEKKGFSGIYGPSLGDSMALCEALAFATNEIVFGTSIMPIYFRQVPDYASTASFIHEVSNGRFRFGIGVSHEPALKARGLNAGKPLTDTRNFVQELRNVPRTGELPPIVLATLRKKMIALSEEIAEGMVFANGARSHMQESLKAISDEVRSSDDFFIGDMIPTCISDDIEAAKAVNRKTLSSYAMLPNYRNYWKEAGYQEEMEGIEKAINDGERDKIPHFLTDKWLADTTLFGSATQVRDGVEAWFDAGIKTPILVPSSANGGQMVAFEEMFAIY
ncbi:MAG: LLM class flavin-dependent oxidoreductase [Gammaproteobacteria bacterium]|nr:LLM class flavin-dependent oxidoreductase [Gammaproteobacteria bacterium]MBT3870849.1 LLM class flavin-dependent oxidoreductase [Gammaproteobacteria bacterium]MBT4380192.1 LLM class flavin-dependent oxidoreductase [Gammaproteobacteria bacterium]MBT4616889.1 LLM class flavin-dependent oxidoreductase [Gammaproteobacteria bacterium]MBT5199789.1 LLM class flavin-dependent oxidoreductase [Gammaproteobacteria bacterium]